jgi:hypothetical protein
MKTVEYPPATREAVQHLVDLLGAQSTELRRLETVRSPEADALVEIQGVRYLIEVKSASDGAALAPALDRLREATGRVRGKVVPLLVVPFMGELGQKLAESAGVSWMDLSGNARVLGPGVRIVIEGRPNRFKRAGRRSSPFAAKSARITRWLLMHPGQPVTQRELARATEMDEGFTSRIVSRLVLDGLLVREESGAIRPRDPDLLLDAWRADYDFGQHEIVRGHISARSGEELARRLDGVLRENEQQHALTGLAAAWFHAPFAAFRLVTVFVSSLPPAEVLASLGFRDSGAGANVWLTLPRDAGVFQGSTEVQGIRCAHPVQTYVDLKAQPERSREAAEELRRRGISLKPIDTEKPGASAEHDDRAESSSERSQTSTSNGPAETATHDSSAPEMAPLAEFDREVLEAARRGGGPIFYRVLNAHKHMNASWRLRVIDPKMAVFRAITAEEEAATALILSLKRLGYRGAERLGYWNHVHKAALTPFFDAVRETVIAVAQPLPEFTLVLTPEIGPTRLEIRVVLHRGTDGRQIVAAPNPPFGFTTTRHIKGQADEVLEDLEQFEVGVSKVVEKHKVATILEHIRERANLRNLLLYASDKGILQLQGDLEKQLRHHYERTCRLLRVYLLIEPYPERQSFVQQCLTALLKMLVMVKADSDVNAESRQP